MCLRTSEKAGNFAIPIYPRLTFFLLYFLLSFRSTTLEHLKKILFAKIANLLAMALREENLTNRGLILFPNFPAKRV